MALILAVCAFVFVPHFTNQQNGRTVLASSNLVQIELPDTVGFEFDILCDRAAYPFFSADEESDISDRVWLRNSHLKAETGADVLATVSDDFYNAAKNDVLSGTYKYDLYAASATNLSRLLAEGELKDLSQSDYIRTSKDYFDEKTIDSLAIGGGKYLISSAVADARLWSAAIAVTKDFEEGEHLRESALEGNFTFEAMHSSGGMLVSEDAVYPLWFGAGGKFVSYTESQPRFISHADFLASVEKLEELTDDGADKSDVFELVTVYGAAKNDWVIILPLPKSSAEEDYSGYVDLKSAVMSAVPKGSPTSDKSEYLLDRMAYLSDSYITPRFDSLFGENAEVYKIIKENSSCDLSVLFGYGDIGGVVRNALRDDTQISLEYYNRKALYEKALSIIAKRLCIEE